MSVVVVVVVSLAARKRQVQFLPFQANAIGTFGTSEMSWRSHVNCRVHRYGKVLVTIACCDNDE